MCQPHLLARGAECDAAAPVEPVGAALEVPARPGRGFIEPADQLEETEFCGIEMTAEGGDFVAETFDVGVVHGARLDCLYVQYNR